MACVGGLDTVTGEPCDDSPAELPQLRTIGQADSGLTIFEDAFGGTYALLPGSPDGRPTRLPAGYAQLVRSQIDNSAGTGVGTISPTAAANIAEDARQFDLSFAANRQDTAADQAFRQQQLGQSDQQLNAQLEQQAAIQNQNARIRVAEINANLSAQRAALEEQIRQNDIDDARDRRNFDFAVRQERIRTEEGNRSALQNAVALRESIASRIESNRLARQSLVTEVNTINTQIENNVRVFNAQEAARVEELNERRRQTNIDDIRANAELIGRLAQNPADAGRLAATLRAGGAGALSSAVASGQNFITEESAAPLGGALGAQRSLLQGPTLATGNFIEGAFVDAPQFDTELGVAPEIADLFQAINFDPSGLDQPGSPAAANLDQFFNPIADPQAIQAGSAVSATQQQALPAPAATPAPAQGAPQPTAADRARVEDLERRGVLPQGTGIDKVGASVSEDAIRKFFEGFAGGGVAAPGMPVIVGDSTDGKPNEELAMVDGSGNLVVVPLDQLPTAQDGGLFRRTPSGVPLRPTEFDNADRGGIGNFGDVMRRRLATQRAPSGVPLTQRTVSTDDITASGRPSVTRQIQPRMANDSGLDLTAGLPTDEVLRRRLAGVGMTLEDLPTAQAAASSPQFLTPDAVIPPPAPEIAQLFGLPTAQSVAQSAQNPQVASGAVAPLSFEETLDFLGQSGRDALRRGGFESAADVSPVRVSAPGTSRFLQDLSSSAFGLLGFGPASVFFEELQRLMPRGVGSGVVGRTA